MTTTKTMRRGGLDWNVPRDGRAADAYAVACTAAKLRASLKGTWSDGANRLPSARATRLHVISGLLHKLAERQCNEDLTCPDCKGEGERIEERIHRAPTMEIKPTRVACHACAGTGLTTGRRLESLRADAREIAEHYGLGVFFQTDPRGCSLYLGENLTDTTQNGPAYDNGHAVTRLGR